MSSETKEKIMRELGDVLRQLAEINERAAHKQATPSDFEKTCMIAKRVKELRARLHFLMIINRDKD